MVGNRVDDATAAAFAAQHGWTATAVAYSGEAKPVKKGADTGVSPQSAAQIGSAALGAVGSVGNQLSFDVRRCGEVGTEVGGRAIRRRNSRSGRKLPGACSARGRSGTTPKRSSA